MKPAIHPKYFDSVNIPCSCGNITVVGSTRDKMKTELCSKCHPFYTGQQKLVDTAGRVDKFEEKRKKAAALKDETRRHNEEKKKKPEVYQEKEVSPEVLAKAVTAAQAQESAKSKWGKPLGENAIIEIEKEEKVEAKKIKKPRISPKKAAVKPKKSKTKTA